MKKIRLIFVFVFLSGMIFTVFQYIPLLEEEVHSHKVELAKKAKQGDLSGGDNDSSNSDENCNDNDPQQQFGYFHYDFYTAFYTSQRSPFSKKNSLYKHQLGSEDTPPPKI